MKRWLVACIFVIPLLFQCMAAFAQVIAPETASPDSAVGPVTCLNDPEPANRCRPGRKEIVTTTTVIKGDIMADMFPTLRPAKRELEIPLPNKPTQ